MFCKNCGYENPDGTKFCGSCGTSLDGIEGNQNYNNNFTWQNETDLKLDYEEEIMKAYIGNQKIYERAKKNSFNIWAILFGMVYYAYRKMYLEAFCILLIQLLLGILLPTFGEYFGWIFGFIFYPLYFKSVKRKVMKIEAENSSANLDELKIIAAKKGGTSIAACITFTFLYLFIIFFIALILS